MLLGFLPPPLGVGNQMSLLLYFEPHRFFLQREVIGFNYRSLALFASFAACQNPSSGGALYIESRQKARETFRSGRRGIWQTAPLLCCLFPPLCVFGQQLNSLANGIRVPPSLGLLTRGGIIAPPLSWLAKKRRDSLSATCSGLES